ncbi:SLC45 family MFS transporter [Candidatus Gracilibacteria bacterium]|nr:SLC45 family MFS transporter [Candidatus Gracilibacteria bacterium]
MRLNYARTFLIGCAFLGLQVLFAIYNAYLPLFLQAGREDFTMTTPLDGGFGLGAGVTGFIMSLENLAALLILPFIGALSDTTASPLGRRKPYLLVGVPITALAFVTLPFLIGGPLWLFMLVTLVFVVFVDVIRTPIIALMPDVTPSALRSQANGVINLMGGLGAVLAFAIGGRLFGFAVTGPFIFGGLALLVGCALVIWLVPTPSSVDLPRPSGGLSGVVRAALYDEQNGLLANIAAVRREGGGATLWLLAAILCLFLNFSALTVFFTSFATDTLRVPRGEEALLLAWFSLAIVVCALPAGIVGARLGRRSSMLLGALIMATALIITGFSSDLTLIRPLLVLAGAGWSLIVVNALPMVLDCAPQDGIERVGAYTGIYFIATQSAEVLGPTLLGGLLDLTGRDFRLIFAYAAAALLLGAALLLRVRSGEAVVVSGGIQESGFRSQ